MKTILEENKIVYDAGHPSTCPCARIHKSISISRNFLRKKWNVLYLLTLQISHHRIEWMFQFLY